MNQQEIQNLADTIDTLEVGLLPEPIFVAVARIAALTGVEFIPFRKNSKGGIEVLLIKRPDEDPIWSNMLHTPGTIIRPSDTSLDSAFQRLFKQELLLDTPLTPSFVGVDIIRYNRGTTTALQYTLDYNEEPNVGKFYDVTNLPDTLITEQIPMINRALEHYKSL